MQATFKYSTNNSSTVSYNNDTGNNNNHDDNNKKQRSHYKAGCDRRLTREEERTDRKRLAVIDV